MPLSTFNRSAAEVVQPSSTGGEDIYRSRPVAPDVVLVEDYLGLHLARAAPGAAKATLASAELDPLARTSVDAGRVAYATSSPAGDTLPTVHVVRPRTTG